MCTLLSTFSTRVLANNTFPDLNIPSHYLTILSEFNYTNNIQLVTSYDEINYFVSSFPFPESVAIQQTEKSSTQQPNNPLVRLNLVPNRNQTVWLNTKGLDYAKYDWSNEKINTVAIDAMSHRKKANKFLTAWAVSTGTALLGVIISAASNSVGGVTFGGVVSTVSLVGVVIGGWGAIYHAVMANSRADQIVTLK